MEGGRTENSPWAPPPCLAHLSHLISVCTPIPFTYRNNTKLSYPKVLYRKFNPPMPLSSSSNTPRSWIVLWSSYLQGIPWIIRIPRTHQDFRIRRCHESGITPTLNWIHLWWNRYLSKRDRPWISQKWTTPIDTTDLRGCHHLFNQRRPTAIGKQPGIEYWGWGGGLSHR